MKDVRFSDLCNFFDKQWEATRVADAHKYTLYGGSRGPGKSYWLRWYVVKFLLELSARGITNVRGGIFCEDYPTLKDRQITKIANEFPAWLGELKESKTEGLAYHFHEQYGGNIIALRNLDESSKYRSAEFAIIAVDELTMNKESVFHKLRGSLRWPGVEAKFIAASNPDGPGQVWVRQYFIEKVYPKEMELLADQFAYVKALPADNPYLPDSYWDELNSLPEPLRSAWRDGNWYTMMRRAVFSEFNQDNIASKEPDPNRPIELAFDDGYIDPRAILFIQRGDSEILVFDEIYHSRHLAEVCIAETIRRCEQNGWPLPELAVGSPEAKEIQKRFINAGIPVRYRPHQIVEGINLVRSLIKDGNGYRTLKVHPRCKNLISELTQGYIYPEQGGRMDEVPLDENNHACDALRMWAWVRVRR